MSTKSHRRASRRHPELSENASGAIGSSILSLVTLGALEESTEFVMPSSEAQPAPAGQNESEA